jgi:hypothetical protein
MQTMQKATWILGFSQATTALLVFLQRDLPNSLQQFVFAISQKQDLVLSKVSQFAGGLASTDAALMAPQLLKQRFHCQVVWRQARYIVTMQPCRTAIFPHTVPSAVEGCLGWTMFEIRLKVSQQLFHLLLDLLTTHWAIGRMRLRIGRGGIPQTLRYPPQPYMGFP